MNKLDHGIRVNLHKYLIIVHINKVQCLYCNLFPNLMGLDIVIVSLMIWACGGHEWSCPVVTWYAIDFIRASDKMSIWDAIVVLSLNHQHRDIQRIPLLMFIISIFSSFLRFILSFHPYVLYKMQTLFWTWRHSVCYCVPLHLLLLLLISRRKNEEVFPMNNGWIMLRHISYSLHL